MLKIAFRSWTLPVLLMLLMPGLAPAQELPAFTVLSGSANNPLTDADGRILLAFWRADCAPCVAERLILKQIAHEHPTLKVVLIPLDGNAYNERHFPPFTEPNMDVWLSEQDADTTLLQMRDIRRALPYSVFLHKDGSTCETHYGLLGTDRADEWMKRC